MSSYAVGVDFGTLSARALLVDVSDGSELATTEEPYLHGVIDHELPETGQPLPPDWALQHPMDYIDSMCDAVRAVVEQSGVDSDQIIGIGIDFTSCTMLPVKANGTPLSELTAFRQEPHAWVKLWKHHAAQPQADRINAVAAERGESWLARYGGRISSEWFFAKSLQILEEAPLVYEAADRLIEAADWVVWMLAGVETRNTCTAGYKAMFQDGTFPARDFFAALDTRFADVVTEKMLTTLTPLGKRVGGLVPDLAERMGLPPGVAVATANVDAHVTAPAVNATRPGQMVMIMGTSTCHILIGDKLAEVSGMCGVVPDGVVPGTLGFEAGQSSVGDIFAWYVDHGVPERYMDAAQEAGMDVHSYLEAEAARLKPGATGLLVLDWWNGNRSTLVDADLSGLLLGVTMATRPPDIYRALIEGTAFGTREIIESFEANGVEVTELVAAGGLPVKNRLLVEIYADVTGLPIRLAGSDQSPALGSAIHAAVAAGCYVDVVEAADVMGSRDGQIIEPDPNSKRIYDELFGEYKTLYDYFGRAANPVMKHLRRLRTAEELRV